MAISMMKLVKNSTLLKFVLLKAYRNVWKSLIVEFAAASNFFEWKRNLHYFYIEFYIKFTVFASNSNVQWQSYCKITAGELIILHLTSSVWHNNTYFILITRVIFVQVGFCAIFNLYPQFIVLASSYKPIKISRKYRCNFTFEFSGWYNRIRTIRWIQ